MRFFIGRRMMDEAVGFGHKMVVSSSSHWEKLYRPLPFLFLGFGVVWFVLVCVWTFNTWSKRHCQNGNLQWMLTIVPFMKALVLGLSFLFWYSCLHLRMCSFWVAFGIFVTRIFLETACFVAFLLISHGYCIMHEQLSASERRTIAGLTSLLYLTLTGYKAAVPQFAVFVTLIYILILYVIFLHLSRNIALLREQLQHIEDEGVQIMRTAIYTKFTMFKKFQAAMLMMVVTEILMHAKTDGVASEYWIRLLVREWTEIGIFFFIGWTFRSREVSPFFTVIPTCNSTGQRTFPPIFSIEMNEKDFKNLNFKEWHIGVPTPQSRGEDAHRPMLVVVQHPSASRLEVSKDAHCSHEASSYSLKSSRSNFSISSGISLPLPRSRSLSLVSDTTTFEDRLRTPSESFVCQGLKGANGVKYCKNEECSFSSRNNADEKSSLLYMQEVVVDMKGFRNYSLVPSSKRDCKECLKLQKENLEQQSFIVRASSLSL